MLKTQKKQPLLSNLPLKLCSLLLGFFCWTIVSQWHYHSKEFITAVCFYNIPKQSIIEAPETIILTLKGAQEDLASINSETIAIHINAQTLKQGMNALIIDNTTLFLPNSLKLIHYKPINSVIKMTTEINQSAS